jgi:hypothetical protein
MESCWPTFMSCKCVLIGPLGYFFTNKSNVPYQFSLDFKEKRGRGRDFLLDVADGGVWSHGGFLVIWTFVFCQDTRIDD